MSLPWLRGVWLRDRPCPEVGELLRAKLDAMARQSRPPRVTAPLELRDIYGRRLGVDAHGPAPTPAVQVWHKNRRNP